MIQNFRTECSWFSSTKLMLLLFFQTWNTLWILSEHNFCYGGNISSGKGQVNVLTWLPWWGLWTPGRMYLGSSHKRVMAWQNKCTARLIFLPVNTLPGWAAEGETLREAGSPQKPTDPLSVPEMNKGPSCAFLPKSSTRFFVLQENVGIKKSCPRSSLWGTEGKGRGRGGGWEEKACVNRYCCYKMTWIIALDLFL